MEFGFFAYFGLLIFHISASVSEKAPYYSFVSQATTAPKLSHYDYIIIGGGTAGCALAATLSENSTVLVLERGGLPYGNPNITNISDFGMPLLDRSPSSPSQQFISTDGVINARARVLGGGTCLNAGFFSRATPGYARAARWDPRLVEESYRWVERKVAFRPKMRRFQTAFKDGLLAAGVWPYNGFTYDHLPGTKIGGTIFDANDHRHTAADLLEYANPNNLRVLLHATVHKILFRKKGSNIVATKVVFRDARGKKHKAMLKKGSMSEVIVSAGALGSPQLLMLSGIGPAEHLKSHNIGVVLDHPMVGKGMSDNPLNGIMIPSPVPIETSLIEAVGIAPSETYFEAISNLKFLFAILPKGKKDPPISQLGMIIAKFAGVISKGELRLRTTNPNDNPSVTFNYFKHPRDLQRCVNELKVMISIIESKPFFKVKYKNLSLNYLLDLTSRASRALNLLPRHENTTTSLEQYCKDTVMTFWHYHGGCQVGRVVDRDYRVFGVNNLRVIDGSTFLTSPGTNPQATLMMLGRYLGVKILRERLGELHSKY